ncbi:hypothetical protein PAXRUDRAFT_825139 [Paxillus rubicundulus Ve08.2h10]|uniref:Uncharacterized protein n=1 Tax=Paxillus rubicundulus Ve08.2h10 TaxID=930991 RepID=A0A0D0E6R7_9AGAM|nr:hypothetical protein PAXRUDRAFT_825139 [Paxillus rubicundulus Ve08.2h10]
MPRRGPSPDCARNLPNSYRILDEAVDMNGSNSSQRPDVASVGEMCSSDDIDDAAFGFHS